VRYRRKTFSYIYLPQQAEKWFSPSAERLFTLRQASMVHVDEADQAVHAGDEGAAEKALEKLHVSLKATHDEELKILAESDKFLSHLERARIVVHAVKGSQDPGKAVTNIVAAILAHAKPRTI
jgi:hypothetical protein